MTIELVISFHSTIPFHIPVHIPFHRLETPITYYNFSFHIIVAIAIYSLGGRHTPHTKQLGCQRIKGWVHMIAMLVAMHELRSYNNNKEASYI